MKMTSPLIVILTIAGFAATLLTVLFLTVKTLYKALSEDDGSIHDLGDGENFARQTSSNRNN
jgi:hypothetical protein